MRRKYFLPAGLVFFLILLTTGSISLGKQPVDEPSQKPLSKEDIFSELELFADALTVINANYVDEVGPQKMIYGALKGMLSSLDSHSSFLTPDELKEIQTETKGEFGGIGIRVTLRDKILTIVSPLEGTPGYKAGILPGDKIIEIDGESTKDFTLDDAVKRLRGVPGEKVKLIILREEEDRLIEFIIRRAIIKIDSVREALLSKGDIGYIRIVEFQQRTEVDLRKALRRLLKDNIKGLILDLRNNPGGLLNAAVRVSERFLKKDKPIVSTKGRIEEQNMDFKSRAIKPFLGFPVVILVNRGSASASEIVAGALRDNQRAAILGETTFGKGSVQTLIPMKDNSALRLTTSYYYTPSGRIIHEKGIAPDVEVKFSRPEATDEVEGEEDQERPEKDLLLERLKSDNQVQAAIELLKDNQRYSSIIMNRSAGLESQESKI